MGNTHASKTRCFCVLFVVHAAQVLSRTITVALLTATQPWWGVVYLGGDFLLLVVYKAAKRDLLYWMPGIGVPVSLLIRFNVKVFADSTACVHFRHPCELGGLYYTLNAALGQATHSPARWRHPWSDPCSGAGGHLRKPLKRPPTHAHNTRAHTRTMTRALTRTESHARTHTNTHTHKLMRTRVRARAAACAAMRCSFLSDGWRRWRR
jgi:hypothetical protein